MPESLEREPIEEEVALRNSQLFTQVEPEWLARWYGKVTYINTSRGVVVQVDRTARDGRGDAKFYYDAQSGDTYNSTGWYEAKEIENWWLPVMRSDKAWKVFIENPDGDITIALDYL